jgi:predicted helicase
LIGIVLVVILSSLAKLVQNMIIFNWKVFLSPLPYHKEILILNAPNAWSCERGNPLHILDLLHSVITVSLRTISLVKTLPSITFAP